MAKDFAEAFYHSTQWKKMRDYIFKKECGICERCNGVNGPGEIVHHKIYLTPDNINNPLITLNEENLELLCRVCHAIEHNGQSPTEESLTFDADGNLIERRQVCK